MWGSTASHLENNLCLHLYKSVDPNKGVACLLPLLFMVTLSLSITTFQHSTEVLETQDQSLAAISDASHFMCKFVSI